MKNILSKYVIIVAKLWAQGPSDPYGILPIATVVDNVSENTSRCSSEYILEHFREKIFGNAFKNTFLSSLVMVPQNAMRPLELLPQRKSPKKAFENAFNNSSSALLRKVILVAMIGTTGGQVSTGGTIPNGNCLDMSQIRLCCCYERHLRRSNCDLGHHPQLRNFRVWSKKYVTLLLGKIHLVFLQKTILLRNSVKEKTFENSFKNTSLSSLWNVPQEINHHLGQISNGKIIGYVTENTSCRPSKNLLVYSLLGKKNFENDLKITFLLLLWKVP